VGTRACLRITHLQSLFYDFAPWFAPQFAKYTSTRDMQNIIRSERLTLASLPRYVRRLNRKVSAMLEDGPGGETQSALRLLRSAITRTNDVAASMASRLTSVLRRPIVWQRAWILFPCSTQEESVKRGIRSRRKPGLRHISTTCCPPKRAPQRLWPLPRATFRKIAG